MGAVPKRATGRYGAVWGENASTLLDILCNVEDKQQLREKRVKREVWQELSDTLFSIGLDYSPDQIREKVKNLKNTFSEAKKGKHRGNGWEHFKSMEIIYDLPFDTAVTTPLVAPLGTTYSEYAEYFLLNLIDSLGFAYLLICLQLLHLCQLKKIQMLHFLCRTSCVSLK